jgi:diguanylate cyclase (GGDEF)-like protein
MSAAAAAQKGRAGAGCGACARLCRHRPSEGGTGASIGSLRLDFTPLGVVSLDTTAAEVQLHGRRADGVTRPATSGGLPVRHGGRRSRDRPEDACSGEKEAALNDPYRVACEVGAVITSSLVLEDVLASVARRIAEAVAVAECHFYEYDDDAQTVVCTAVWAPEAGAAQRQRLGSVTSLCELPGLAPVFLRGDRVERYAGEDSDGAVLGGRDECAVLCQPLVFEDEVIGCIALVETRAPRRFDEADKHLVSLLTVPAAVAVHNARMYRRQEQQNRHLASLLDSSRGLTSAVALEDVLDLVCRDAATALDVRDSVIYEYDPDADTIAYRAIYAQDPESDAHSDIGNVYALADYPSDRAIIVGGEVVEESILDEDLAEDVRETMRKWGEKTCLNVPLVFDGEPLGLLIIIETQRTRRFSAAETELARGLGEQAAVAIRHAQLYRRQEHHNRRLLALLETSRVLAASLDAGQVLAEMRSEAAELFGVPRGAVVVYVRVEGAYLPLERALQALNDEDGASAHAGGAAQLDELRRRALDAGAPAQHTGARHSRLVVPLLMGGEPEGFVEVRASGPRPISQAEVDLLQMLAGQAGAAMVNSRLYRTVERQAITDGLTGLRNHRYFYERLAQECKRAQRYRLPLSLLMVDIDDFKQFNDRYGHQVGDGVLSRVARVLSGQLRRQVDLAARYGGEEFVVLLPNTAADGALVVAERLLAEVRALAAPAAAPDGEEPLPAPITVSVGLATLPESAGGPDELVRNADKALYLAKRRGKDRLEAYTP